MEKIPPTKEVMMVVTCCHYYWRTTLGLLNQLKHYFKSRQQNHSWESKGTPPQYPLPANRAFFFGILDHPCHCPSVRPCWCHISWGGRWHWGVGPLRFAAANQPRTIKPRPWSLRSTNGSCPLKINGWKMNSLLK